MDNVTSRLMSIILCNAGIGSESNGSSRIPGGSGHWNDHMALGHHSLTC